MKFGAEPYGEDHAKDEPVTADQVQATAKPRPQTKSIVREILETIVLTLIIFLSVRTVVQNFKVEGYSMEPTVHTGQYILVNKAAYFHFSESGPLSFLPGTPLGSSNQVYPFGGPQRGDIIVFEYPEDPSRDFIKRVIGLPGDTVDVRNGKVYVDGTALNEPYLRDAPEYTMPSPVTVPADSVFVLGDNRNNSSDSHVWGCLPLDRIIGKAWVSYWPPDSWGLLPHFNLSSEVK